MEYWIWLTMIKGIGPVTANRLLDKFDSPASVYQADRPCLELTGCLTSRQIELILENRDISKAFRVMEQCKSMNISILTKLDAEYPEKAKRYVDSPIILYYKGQIRDIGRSVGIVGARRCTQLDKLKVSELTVKFTADNKTIVSGMAKGIDSYAHTECLNSEGYTIAIVGNGLDICYPSEHVKLMEAIEDRGLLLSEYPPGTRPSRYTFPQRNRLISAWSDELVVIGAGKGSGALITAGIARKQGKRVMEFGA